ASGTAMVAPAVERGHHGSRIIARQGGEDGRKRSFYYRADLVGSDRGTHVLRISMWCWCRTAPPLRSSTKSTILLNVSLACRLTLLTQVTPIARVCQRSRSATSATDTLKR